MAIGQCSGCHFIFTQLRTVRRAGKTLLVTPNESHLRAMPLLGLDAAHLREDGSLCGEVHFFGALEQADALVSERELYAREEAYSVLLLALDRREKKQKTKLQAQAALSSSPA